MSSMAAVPKLFGLRDQFCGRQFSHGQSRGMVSGRFKLITFIAHFSSPLLLLLISHEALVHGPEVGDPCSKGLSWLYSRVAPHSHTNFSQMKISSKTMPIE